MFPNSELSVLAPKDCTVPNTFCLAFSSLGLAPSPKPDPNNPPSLLPVVGWPNVLVPNPLDGWPNPLAVCPKLGEACPNVGAVPNAGLLNPPKPELPPKPKPEPVAVDVVGAPNSDPEGADVGDPNTDPCEVVEAPKREEVV